MGRDNISMQITQKYTHKNTLPHGASKEFNIILLDRWVDVPKGYELEFQMVHGAERESFGDTVTRQVLVNPYMKKASWNKFSTQRNDDIAVYFKSTRSDTEIDVLAMRCNGQTCIEANTIETLPPNKALYKLFTAAALNGKTYGELRLYYAPHSEIALSDKDIIASFSDSSWQGNNLQFFDAAFEERYAKKPTSHRYPHPAVYP